MSEAFERQVDHRPDQCPCCQAKLSQNLPAETASQYETIELPEIHPVVERHRRLSVPSPWPTGSKPLGPRRSRPIAGISGLVSASQYHRRAIFGVAAKFPPVTDASADNSFEIIKILDIVSNSNPKLV